MKARDVKTKEDAINIINERNLTHVKVGVFDMDGVMRGKYMSKEKFISSLDSGFAFCSVVLGWDSKDQPYDNVSFTGWHTGYGVFQGSWHSFLNIYAALFTASTVGFCGFSSTASI